MRLGRREIGPAAAARGQYDDLRLEQMQSAVFEPPCHDPTALAFLHDQVEHDVLDEELGIVLEALLVEGMEHRMPGPVGGGAGALGQSLAPLHGVAAERPLVDEAFLGARERHAEMLEFDDGSHCIAAHNSIASWSPSQSDPLTVSYMCQRQSSSPILPSAAPIPPCAATVWLRVGNTLLMQAVLSPAAVIPNVARRPAPPPPTTTTS